MVLACRRKKGRARSGELPGPGGLFIWQSEEGRDCRLATNRQVLIPSAELSRTSSYPSRFFAGVSILARTPDAQRGTANRYDYFCKLRMYDTTISPGPGADSLP